MSPGPNQYGLHHAACMKIRSRKMLRVKAAPAEKNTCCLTNACLPEKKVPWEKCNGNEEVETENKSGLRWKKSAAWLSGTWWCQRGKPKKYFIDLKKLYACLWWNKCIQKITFERLQCFTYQIPHDWPLWVVQYNVFTSALSTSSRLLAATTWCSNGCGGRLTQFTGLREKVAFCPSLHSLLL